MKVVIAKVNEVYFDGAAVSLTLPASEGQMTVLQNHEPLITTLKKGKIVVHLPAPIDVSPESAQREFQIESGIVEVRRDGATVIL